MRRWECRVEPAFSTTTWTIRSPRTHWASHAFRGTAQKSTEEGPQTPSAPDAAPAKVRSWKATLQQSAGVRRGECRRARGADLPRRPARPPKHRSRAG
eukprot:15464984-Alexandrium_andersonii.AAC.1